MYFMSFVNATYILKLKHAKFYVYIRVIFLNAKLNHEKHNIGDIQGCTIFVIFTLLVEIVEFSTSGLIFMNAEHAAYCSI